MRDGLFEADLGGGVYKKRISIGSKGKRGGGRVMVAFQRAKHSFFIFGFIKNQRTNIDQVELKGLKQYAKYLLGLGEEQISTLLTHNELFEIGTHWQMKD